MTLAARDNVRQLLEWSLQEHGESMPSAVLSPIESVGIVGAGMMGRAIASVHIEHQVPVVISDSNEAVLAVPQRQSPPSCRRTFVRRFMAVPG